MNGETGTSIDGKHYYITNSAYVYSELEESFKNKVLKDTDVDELYFVGGKDAAETLLSGGGLDCITTELPSSIQYGFSLKDNRIGNKYPISN